MNKNKGYKIYCCLCIVLFMLFSCNREQDPTLSRAGKDTVVYDTTRITMYANQPEYGKGYWSFVKGYNGKLADTNDPGTVFTGVANRSYTLRWTITSEQGYSNDQVDVTFITAAAYAGKDSAFLDTNSIELWALPPKEGTGTWSVTKGNGYSFSDTSNPNSLFTVENDTVYTLKWTVKQEGSEKSDLVTITFRQTTANAGNDTSIYDYSSCILTANRPLHGSGKWTVLDGDGEVLDADDPHSVFKGEMDSSFVLRWTINNAFGSTSDEVHIIFISTGSPPIAYAGENQDVFNTDTAGLNGNSPPPDGTGKWSVVDGTGGSFEDISDPKTNFYGTIGETYTLRWTLANAFGLAFDDVLIDFKISPFSCGDNLYDARDGKSYATVQIGNQCWMAENINIGTMINGSSAQKDNGTIEKYCYSNLNSNCQTYGGLYQWNEMMDYSPSDNGNPGTTRGICPEGWHIPTDNEWKELEMFLGMSQLDADKTNTWRGSPVGTKLKEGGGSGYEGKLAGRRTSSGMFSLLDQYEYPWTATESGSYGWRRCLRAGDPSVGRWNTFPKSYGFSVRCIKD